MNILLFLDTETTGLNPIKHDIVQIAGVAYYNGEWAGTINLSCQPFSYDNISIQALNITGLSVDKIKSFQEPQRVFRKFIQSLHNIKKNIGTDSKFRVIAHNAPFDKRFVTSWWKKCSESINDNFPSMNDIFLNEWTDTLKISRELTSKKILDCGNKLESLAENFNIKFEGKGAHDALSDTLVLREVFEKMNNICLEAVNSGQRLGATRLLKNTHG